MQISLSLFSPLPAFLPQTASCSYYYFFLFILFYFFFEMQKKGIRKRGRKGKQAIPHNNKSAPRIVTLNCSHHANCVLVCDQLTHYIYICCNKYKYLNLYCWYNHNFPLQYISGVTKRKKREWGDEIKQRETWEEIDIGITTNTHNHGVNSTHLKKD